MTAPILRDQVGVASLAGCYRLDPADDSVWYFGTGNKGQDLAPLFICSAISCFVARSQASFSYFAHIETPFGTTESARIFPGELRFNGFVSKLLDRGLRVGTSSNVAKLLAEYIQASAVPLASEGEAQ